MEGLGERVIGSDITVHGGEALTNDMASAGLRAVQAAKEAASSAATAAASVASATSVAAKAAANAAADAAAPTLAATAEATANLRADDSKAALYSAVVQAANSQDIILPGTSGWLPRLPRPPKPGHHPDYPFENLVCKGGGAKGVVYPGMAQALEELGILSHIKRFAGASAGSVVGCLLALGLDAEQYARQGL